MSLQSDLIQIFVLGLQGVLDEVTLLESITDACRNCVSEFVRDRVDKDGRVSTSQMNNLLRMTGLQKQPYERVLKDTPFQNADESQLKALFEFLEFCLSQV